MIRLTSDGFSITGQDGTAKQAAWASIKEVFVFKVDLLTHDTIRLGFRVSDDGTCWEIDEDDPAFSELLAEVEQRFDVPIKNWWSKVAFPPFATNRTTLWSEPWNGP